MSSLWAALGKLTTANRANLLRIWYGVLKSYGPLSSLDESAYLAVTMLTPEHARMLRTRVPLRLDVPTSTKSSKFIPSIKQASHRFL